jgi:cytochrome b involved in lipid metabolism
MNMAVGLGPPRRLLRVADHLRVWPSAEAVGGNPAQHVGGNPTQIIGGNPALSIGGNSGLNNGDNPGLSIGDNPRQPTAAPLVDTGSLQRMRVFPESRGYTVAELAAHNTEEDCWLAVDGKVYDVSGFLRSHPGGIRIVLPYAGTDATEIFHALHNSDFLEEFGERYRIGHLPGVGESVIPWKGPSRPLNVLKNTYDHSCY